MGGKTKERGTTYGKTTLGVNASKINVKMKSSRNKKYKYSERILIN